MLDEKCQLICLSFQIDYKLYEARVLVCSHTQYSVSRPGIAHPLTDEMAFLELVFPVPTVEVCLTWAGAIFS